MLCVEIKTASQAREAFPVSLRNVMRVRFGPYTAKPSSGTPPEPPVLFVASNLVVGAIAIVSLWLIVRGKLGLKQHVICAPTAVIGRALS